MKKLVVFLSIIILTGCSTKDTKSGSNSALYGYVNISLPKINGMVECSAHPNVQQITRKYLETGPVLGYYLNNATYRQIDKLSEITYDNYFMIYGDYQRENYHAIESDLEVVESNLQQTLFEGENFEQISTRIDEVYGTITAGKPALIEKYSSQPNVRTMLLLMKYKNDTGETSVVSAINFILVKNRILNLAYYMAYAEGKSIDLLKEKNNEAVKKILDLN